VTDGRYVYLRNYFPHVSQGQRVSYQFETPTTRIWRQWFDEGVANEAQSIFWKTPKASEELYDLQTDPDEVRNLVNSPEHRAILEKLRQAQREHAVRIRASGRIPSSGSSRRRSWRRRRRRTRFGNSPSDWRIPTARCGTGQRWAS
jgi:uncharacterized sulfatase